jgi:hypothetical protein
MQQTSASWQLATYYRSRPLEEHWWSQWSSRMYISLASERREIFPDNARPGVPSGFPTLQSALESLTGGGSVRMEYGWFYSVWQEIPCGESATSEHATPECVPESVIDAPLPQVNMRYLAGTYALDTTATAVPEPASLLLLASGLALARVRSARRMRLSVGTPKRSNPAQD